MKAKYEQIGTSVIHFTDYRVTYKVYPFHDDQNELKVEYGLLTQIKLFKDIYIYTIVISICLSVCLFGCPMDNS